MFDEFISLKSREEVANFKDIRVDLSYEYDTSNMKVYVLDIKNKTDKEIDIDFVNSARYITTLGKIYYGSLPSGKKIEAEETMRVMVYFPKMSFGESSLELDATVNGVNRTIKIVFDDEIL